MKITPEISREQQIQFLKFIIVGGINTMVTLATIFVCKSLLGVNPYLSNAIGYVAGVANSFLWNRSWVFRSHGGFYREMAKFFIGFGICYALQFACIWTLTKLHSAGHPRMEYQGIHTFRLRSGHANIHVCLHALQLRL